MILNTIKHKNMLFFLLFVHNFTQTSLPCLGNSNSFLPSVGLSNLNALGRDFLKNTPNSLVCSIALSTLLGMGTENGKFSLKTAMKTATNNPKRSLLGFLGLGSYAYRSSIMQFFTTQLFNPSSISTTLQELSPLKKVGLGLVVASAIAETFSVFKKTNTTKIVTNKVAPDIEQIATNCEHAGKFLKSINTNGLSASELAEVQNLSDKVKNLADKMTEAFHKGDQIELQKLNSELDAVKEKLKQKQLAAAPAAAAPAAPVEAPVAPVEAPAVAVAVAETVNMDFLNFFQPCAYFLQLST